MQSGAIKSRCHILRNRFGNNKKAKSCPKFYQKTEKKKKKKKERKKEKKRKR